MTTVEQFAALVLAQRVARLRHDFPDSPFMADAETVQVKPGKVYTKVDVGPRHNMSGKYMVDNETGIIYGIKAYGKVHKGHVYGTLDTIDAWDWGGYVGREVA
jgi:hypothetical protein